MKKQSGFTLIELMVVMAIIAILATAGLTAYSNYLKKARDSARVQTARQLMTKVEELANGGPLPTPAQLLSFLVTENFAPVVGGYLDLDPLGTQSFNCYGPYNGTFTGLCAFAYGRIPDGTYFVSYPVEHPDNVENMWILNGLGGDGIVNEYTSGKIISTNSYLVDTNSETWLQVPNFDLWAGPNDQYDLLSN